MKLLLDTHILLWLTLKPDFVPGPLLDALIGQEHQLMLSAVNAWEISIKHHLGKLPEAAPLIADFDAVAAQLGATILNITAAHALRAGALDWAHRDPFDRLLVAQAQVEGIQVVTLDEHIIRIPVDQL